MNLSHIYAIFMYNPRFVVPYFSYLIRFLTIQVYGFYLGIEIITIKLPILKN